MRTGAAGVLVGFGGAAAHTTRTVLGVAVPMGCAVADVAAAPGATTWTSRAAATSTSSRTGRSASRVTSPRRSRAVPTRSWSARPSPGPPTHTGRGFHWGAEAHHHELPRGQRVEIGTVGTIAGDPVRSLPGGRRHDVDLIGALKRTRGHDRIHGAQGVPAGRGRGRVTTTLGEPATTGVDQRADARGSGAPRRLRAARGSPPGVPVEMMSPRVSRHHRAVEGDQERRPMAFIRSTVLTRGLLTGHHRRDLDVLDPARTAPAPTPSARSRDRTRRSPGSSSTGEEPRVALEDVLGGLVEGRGDAEDVVAIRRWWWCPWRLVAACANCRSTGPTCSRWRTPGPTPRARSLRHRGADDVAELQSARSSVRSRTGVARRRRRDQRAATGAGDRPVDDVEVERITMERA